MYRSYNGFDSFGGFDSPNFHANTAQGFAEGLAASVLIFIAVVYFILFAYLIVNYVLRSIGLYRIGKKNGVSNAWLAWIPIGNLYVLGESAGEVSFGKRTIKKTSLWLILTDVIGAMLIVSTYVGFIITLIIMGVGIDNGGAEAAMAMVMVCISMFIALMVVAIVYSICWYLLYGMTYFTLCKKYKSTERSVFYLLMALFVPLADAIIMFKLGKLDACGGDVLTEIPAAEQA